MINMENYRQTSLAVILSLTLGAANILKAVIVSTTRGMDSERTHTARHYIASALH